MKILSIETSCDETAIAIIDTEGEFPACTFTILANQTLTQIEMHKQYGGVFPMVAKREHARTLVPLLKNVLKEAGLYKVSSRHVLESPLRKEFAHMLEREPELYAQFISEIPNWNPPNIDMIAVTSGPGLEPALWVGINFAKALSLVWKIPVLPINHMEGHMLTPLLETTDGGMRFGNINFPVLGLLVSGGHTELILMKEWGAYELLGETKDDAVGEAFDKVARILGLPYPGGPEIARLALLGTPGKFTLPRPMLHAQNFDFSFSGLKTAVLYLTKDLGTLSDEQKQDIARDFEDACAEVLTHKTRRAAEEYGAETIVVGGGVSANMRLREVLTTTMRETNPEILVSFPGASLSTDNALMIAVAAATRQKHSRQKNVLYRKTTRYFF
ncbi:MAG: UGMP family protein [Parcubacteria group bacterium GW2011_GWA2_47_7]|nr:MAG: UGMP family protein [Parcubacteria group bacterium GW2011_GWA2_47_7]